MDLWSAGCVFYEIASLQPLFPGVNELDQISKIHDVIGTPCQKTLTKFKQDQEYLHCQPICPHNASPCCVQWWLTTLMNESRLTKPFSTPISRCKGQLRHRPWPATEKLASPKTPWSQSHPVTTGHSQRSAESRYELGKTGSLQVQLVSEEATARLWWVETCLSQRASHHQGLNITPLWACVRNILIAL